MRDYKKEYITCASLHDSYRNSLAVYLKKKIADNERVISIVAEYNSYGSIYAYEIYIEVNGYKNNSIASI